MTTARSRVPGVLALSLLGAALSGCTDDFFYPTAPSAKATAALALSLSGPEPGVLTAGSAPDHAWIRITGDSVYVDTLVSVPAAGGLDAQFEFIVEKPRGVSVIVELRAAEIPVSRGIAQVVLRPDATADAEVALFPTRGAIATGSEHSCAISTQGQAYCWGSNSGGQLGNPSTPWIGAAVPTPVASAPSFSSVVAGGVTSCALTAEGAAYCWGFNGSGAVGNGEVSPHWPHAQTIPAPVAGGRAFADLDVGGGWEATHACAITPSGEAYCWGANRSGQLGTGSQTMATTPQPVSGGLRFRAITTGGGFSCAVATSLELYCWGENGDAQLGTGTNAPALTPQRVAIEQRFVAVSAGYNHACALSTTGRVYCWGSNQAGQLGSSTRDSRVPVLAAEGTQYVAVRVGAHSTCALSAKGEAFCWGDNWTGRLGVGTIGGTVMPVQVAPGRSFRWLDTGDSHACAVTLAGEAFCWGSVGNGALGQGSVAAVDRPHRVGGVPALVALETGNQHTCGLDQAGTAYCWGNNVAGQLGGGQRSPWGGIPTPQQVVTADVFRAIATGSMHVCAITAAGGASCWGRNDSGQLGRGNTGWSNPVPEPVKSTARFTQISAGWNHTCAVTDGGEIHCWGRNDSGQLGDGTGNNALTPVRVEAGVPFARVSAGGRHTCAIAQDGDAYCWGSNQTGQLGAAAGERSARPVRVSGGLKFREIAAGGSDWNEDGHTCGLTTDGLAYCWGAEWGCKLGNGGCGASVVHSTPIPVAGQLSFSTLTVGDHGGCAATQDGVAHCWGSNYWGEFGVGHNGDRHGSFTTDPGSAIPIAQRAGPAFQSLTSTTNRVCGLASGGEAYCWGARGFGAVGDGDTQFRPTPQPVSGGIVFR